MADDFLLEFIDESRTHLVACEQILLALKPDVAPPADEINAAFRALHTVKGGAGFLEQEAIQRLAHAGEMVLDALRTGQILPSRERLDALLKTVTDLQGLLDMAQGTAPESGERPEPTLQIARLKDLVSGLGTASAPAPARKRTMEGWIGELMASEASDTASIRSCLDGMSAEAGPDPTPAARGLLAAMREIPLDGSIAAYERLLALASDLLTALVVHTPTATVPRPPAPPLPPKATSLQDPQGLVTLLNGLMAECDEPRGLHDQIRFAHDVLVTDGPESRIPVRVRRIEGLIAAWTAARQAPTSAPAQARLTATPAGASTEQPGNTGGGSPLLDFMAESLDLLMNAERIALGGIPDAEGINAIFRAFHTIKGMASYLSQPLVETDAHTIETRLLPLRDGERPFGDDDRAYILTSVDRLRTTIACLTDTPAVPRIGDVLVAEGVPRAAVEETARHLKPGQRLGDALIEEGKATKAQVEQAVQVQHQVAKPAVDGFSRVATSKLEDLMNLVGELLISQAQIVHDPDLILGTRLQQEAVRQSRIIRDVQLLALSLRMVPLRGTFQKLARAVHDTARKVNKEVEFTVQGEDTEVDRTLAETIADPLLHMVRNGVDHGLETAEVRLSRGKSAQGNLRLAACHAGDHVVITLADDGNGMDPARLRAKAVEKGLIAADAVLTDHQAYDLIFAPGFSTAAAVTNVSGRGVGMDVVRRAVESAKGSISIDSVLGRGSTFTIRLPLTTAILDAMVLRIGKQHYLLPISAIVEAVRPGPAQVQSLLGRERILQSRGRSLPIVHLGSLFGIPDTIEDPCSSIMLVIEDGARGLALQACEIIGQQQVVIKPLSQAIRHHPGVSGTAILGDGRVGLILDPTRLSGP